MFQLVDHERQTRHNRGLKIKLPIPKNQHVRHAPFYVGSSIWNNLTLRGRGMDLHAFKKEIQNRIQNNLINIDLEL